MALLKSITVHSEKPRIVLRYAEGEREIRPHHVLPTVMQDAMDRLTQAELDDAVKERIESRKQAIAGLALPDQEKAKLRSGLDTKEAVNALHDEAKRALGEAKAKANQSQLVVKMATELIEAAEKILKKYEV